MDFSLLYEHIFGVYIVACSHAQTPAEAHFFVSINSMIFFLYACAKLQVVFCACSKSNYVEISPHFKACVSPITLQKPGAIKNLKSACYIM